MQYTVKQTRDFVLVQLEGRLTSEDHRGFAEIVSRLSKAGDRHVIFDAGAVDYIDSSGFGMLIVANETAFKGGGEFRIRNAPEQFKQLARRVRAAHLMRID